MFYRVLCHVTCIVAPRETYNEFDMPRARVAPVPGWVIPCQRCRAVVRSADLPTPLGTPRAAHKATERASPASLTELTPSPAELTSSLVELASSPPVTRPYKPGIRAGGGAERGTPSSKWNERPSGAAPRAAAELVRCAVGLACVWGPREDEKGRQ